MEEFEVLEQESVSMPAMAAAGWYMARLIPLNASVRGMAIHIFLLLYQGTLFDEGVVSVVVMNFPPGEIM